MQYTLLKTKIMRTRTIFFAVLLVLAALFISMKTIFASDLGPHGGKTEKAGDHYIEVQKDDAHFYAFLLNKDKESIKNTNISCEIKFFLLDGTSLNIPLKPFGDEAFVIDYFESDYESYRITFEVEGKSVNAKFDKESFLVKGE